MNIKNTIRTGLLYAGLGATALTGCSQPNVYNMNPADLSKLIESNYTTATQDETISFTEARRLARDIRDAQEHQAYHGGSPALDELIAKNKEQIDAYLKDKQFRIHVAYVNKEKEHFGLEQPLAPEGKKYEKGTAVPEDLPVAEELTELLEDKKVFARDVRIGVAGQVTYDQLVKIADSMGTTVYELVAVSHQEFPQVATIVKRSDIPNTYAVRLDSPDNLGYLTTHFGSIKPFGQIQPRGDIDEVYALLIVQDNQTTEQAQTQPQTMPAQPADNTPANNASADNVPANNAPVDNTPAANNTPAGNSGAGTFDDG